MDIKEIGFGSVYWNELAEDGLVTCFYVVGVKSVGCYYDTVNKCYMLMYLK
jgi:hypothetical protein